MFARKKYLENADPRGRDLGTKKIGEVPVKAGQSKTKRVIQTRRAAFGDITNATKDKTIEDGKKKIALPIKPIAKTQITTTNTKNTRASIKAKEVKKEQDLKRSVSTSSVNVSTTSVQVSSSQESSASSQVLKNLAAGVPADRVEEDFSFVIVEDTCEGEKLDLQKSGSEKTDLQEPEKSLLSIDQELYTDVFNVGIYAQDIFEYYKRREKMFTIPPYLGSKHCQISPSMRAILVDWMVEIQENFELNHETLYLGVKLTDIYLSRVKVDKEMLQLVGAAALFISSKFDERFPPMIEDIIYICDNAFGRDEFIQMEMELLRKVDFDLGIPISYRFLRRYAKIARMSIVTLTLARYILEMSLMDCQFMVERDSKMAAATLFIAQKMKNEGSWDGEIVKGSGYELKDFKHLIAPLNKMLLSLPTLPSSLSTVRGKYSHIVFHEVAKIPPLPTEELLK
ncbi:unnamed protein product [Lymnaea stagnalis]|uniref:G2/mitotic-specific cyclin-B3 n=1 Tax=Lymnaea stagnalis TaxID=6523 RepID=A0AAV2HIH2_LYMST